MNEKKKTICDLKRLGGRLCLDFINTLDWRGARQPVEYMHSYEDLALWSRCAGVAGESEVAALLQTARADAAKADRIVKGAVKLRETLHRIFYAIIQGRAPAPGDLTAFNTSLSKTMKHSRIVAVKDGYMWDSNHDKGALDWVLNPVIRSAADLLVSSDELKRVKTCLDTACGWLFLDTSRNQSRRWCDMKDCGNRAKASRFYQKRRRT